MTRSSATNRVNIPEHEREQDLSVLHRNRRWVLGAGGLFIAGCLGRMTASATPSIATPLASPEVAIPNASVFALIRNTGSEPGRLVAATTDVAETVMLRTFDDSTGFRTEHIDPVDIDLPAERTFALAPGEPQLFLTGVNRVLPPNTWFPLTLTFALAGTIVVPVNVRWGGAPIITNVNRANRYTSGDITVIEPWAFPVGQAEIVTPIPASPTASPQARANDGH